MEIMIIKIVIVIIKIVIIKIVIIKMNKMLDFQLDNSFLDVYSTLV